MNKEIFSVVIPVYNAERTLSRTMASLISNKDFIHEIILVDDNSTDDSFKDIDKFRTFFPNLKIIDNKGNKGPGPSRRAGLLEATGEWVTFVDADDCLTASSLYYVHYYIEHSNDWLTLLHCQSIFYESGRVVPENIGHNDTSCGGNFYKREYLIDHNLLPHEELFMAEDEYFNELVIKYMTYCDYRASIRHFDYPVYEVHHDIKEGKSFATSNWGDYLCKYHLLAKEYLVEFFKDNEDLKKNLYKDFSEGFIFCYWLLQGLIKNDSYSVTFEDYKECFQRAYTFYKRTFRKTRKDLIAFYDDHRRLVDSVHEAAEISEGFQYEADTPFKDFMELL